MAIEEARKIRETVSAGSESPAAAGASGADAHRVPVAPYGGAPGEREAH